MPHILIGFLFYGFLFPQFGVSVRSTVDADLFGHPHLFGVRRGPLTVPAVAPFLVEGVGVRGRSAQLDPFTPTGGRLRAPSWLACGAVERGTADLELDSGSH